MKILKNILQKVFIKKLIGSYDIPVKKLSQHSLIIDSNILFAASHGNRVDGHSFIDNAIQNGAKIILCEKLPEIINKNVTYILVNNTIESLGIIASNFYDNPSEKLKLIGVTGTNGKTTITTLLYNLFSRLGEKSTLLSSIITKIIDEDIPSMYTTPDIIQINQYLNKAVKLGCRYTFMEVSSHGIDQKRISGLNFAGGIFTNITHDHLDYHKTFQNYLLTKKKFFNLLSQKSFALVNADDKYVSVILENSIAQKQSYGLKKTADYKAKILEKNFHGTKILINNYKIWTPLIGVFNIYNLLAVYGMAVAFGKNPQKILKIINILRSVKGRFQQILSTTGIRVIVDYAHTPHALKYVLQTIQELQKNQGRLICIIGCGGNRDKKKRPIMAKIAYEQSDQLILTSDNPRYEDPEKIIDEMEITLNIKNKKKSLRISNRKKAIKSAILLAKPKDIILIAGKGHENFQEIQGIQQKFNDIKIAKKILSNLEKLKLK